MVLHAIVAREHTQVVVLVGGVIFLSHRLHLAHKRRVRRLEIKNSSRTIVLKRDDPFVQMTDNSLVE